MESFSIIYARNQINDNNSQNIYLILSQNTESRIVNERNISSTCLHCTVNTQ